MALRGVIDCRRPEVRALTDFVAARAVEDRRAGWTGSGPDQAVMDVCGLADCLLNRVRACQSVEPCLASGRLIAAMVQVALLHSEHPEFHPSWFALGRGGDEVSLRSAASPDDLAPSDPSDA